MLKQLHLTFNHLQASAVKQIAFELPRLVHMEKLFLSYNSLGEEGGGRSGQELDASDQDDHFALEELFVARRRHQEHRECPAAPDTHAAVGYRK